MGERLDSGRCLRHSKRVNAMTRLFRQSSLGLVLLMPWFLLHARVGAEIAFDLVAAGFLVVSAVRRDWRWLRAPWVLLAGAWWGWLMVCTAIGATRPGSDGASLLQAGLVLRFLLATAAIEHWVLAGRAERRWFFGSLAAATVYVAAQTLLQFATGHNLYGVPRSEDGELTGPFTKPRDAPTFIRMLFPVLLPAAAGLIAGGWGRRLAGAALVAGAMAVVVLIGQRMPLLLAGLGLVTTGLLLPRLRGVVVIAVVAAGALVGASFVVAPPTFYRLVTKFTQQMEGFAASPYGLIAERTVAIIEQHPLVGRGYDGYRTGCTDPRYFQAWHWPGEPAAVDPSGTTLCLTHPHNLYLQAASDAGLPGLVLFCALVAVWLRRLARGMLRTPAPARAGVFVALLIQLWPVASTSPLVSLPIGGWFFLLLGLGLAQANDYMSVESSETPHVR